MNWIYYNFHGSKINKIETIPWSYVEFLSKNTHTHTQTLFNTWLSDISNIHFIHHNHINHFTPEKCWYCRCMHADWGFFLGQYIHGRSQFQSYCVDFSLRSPQHSIQSHRTHYEFVPSAFDCVMKNWILIIFLSLVCLSICLLEHKHEKDCAS